MTVPAHEPLLTPEEVAEVLRVDPSTVRRQAAAGLIPAFCFRGTGTRVTYRFKMSEILDYSRVPNRQRR